MPIDLEVLRRIPLFATLESDDLKSIAAVTRERSYTRDESILLAGQSGGALYYVRDGLVKVYKTSSEGKEQILRLMATGQTFNDVPALDGGPNPASAMAMEATTVYFTSGAELRRLIAERPGVAQATVRTLASALRHLVTLVEDLSFRHVRARVAKILLEQEEGLEADGKPRRRLTQQEIAAMVGAAREVVGRALKELEAAGAIQNVRGHITVLDHDRLQLLMS